MSLFSVRKIAGLVAFLAALSLAVPGMAQTGGVTGKATKMDGNPCVKCRIVIKRQEIHAVYKTKTNKKGQYTYIGLPIGMYKIFLEDPSGKPLFYIEQHVGMGNPEEVDFDLPKLMASQKQTQQEEQAQQPPPSQMTPEEKKAREEYAKKLSAQQKKEEAERQKEEKQFTGLKKYFEEGKTLYQQKNYKAAAASFEKALPLAKGKNVPIVLTQLAAAYQKAKEYQQSVDTYQKVIQMKPDDANLHNNLGSVYADMGKYPEAQAQFEKAAQLNPAGASRYYFNIGAIMYNAGKMDEASQAFKKVIQLNPKNAEAYFLEGQSLMGKATMSPNGKVVAPKGTIEAYETYLKLEPNGPNAATAKAILQTLQGGVQTQYKKKGKS